MTESEAIEYLKNRYLVVGNRVNGGEKGIKRCEQHNESIDMAIKALEKQIPKKPIRHAVWEDFKCPACGSTEIRPYDTEYREYDKNCEFEYCSDCGQKLDWSDEE